MTNVMASDSGSSSRILGRLVYFAILLGLVLWGYVLDGPEQIDSAILSITELFPARTFFSFPYNVRGSIAILLTGIVCGAVSSLVVGNRMAFLSGALTHSAFAGVSLGFLIALAFGVRSQSDFYEWITPVMVVFGILVGLGIAFVRDRTRLASDTVIGVFNAGGIGFGAVLLGIVAQRQYFEVESFLFGTVQFLPAQDLIHLLVVLMLTIGLLNWLYNDMVFASINPSLARSRGVKVKLCNYLFVALLAAIVNVCLKTVGVLLVHALLIVPAATAANFCHNLRQLFWWTLGLCVFVGIIGQWISWNAYVLMTKTHLPEVSIGIGGTMVLVAVLLFFISMPLGAWLKGRPKG